jgi:hypothetical protein
VHGLQVLSYFQVYFEVEDQSEQSQIYKLQRYNDNGTSQCLPVGDDRMNNNSALQGTAPHMLSESTALISELTSGWLHPWARKLPLGSAILGVLWTSNCA